MVKIGKFLNFCLSRCQFQIIFVYKTAFISPLSILDIQFTPCGLNPIFQFPEFVESSEKNCIKSLKIENFWSFFSISVSNLDSFQLKTVFISSLKTTGQRVGTLENVFNVLILEVCQNCDRKCTKT